MLIRGVRRNTFARWPKLAIIKGNMMISAHYSMVILGDVPSYIGDVGSGPQIIFRPRDRAHGSSLLAG